jgi:Terminase large subunit, T4likevirus-type, N-terminal
MPLDDIGRTVCCALDGVSFAEDRLSFTPDPWQRRLLRSQSRRILLNCCRQSGKSTTTAIVAVHQAVYDPGLVLCVSPSLRQSRELFAKTLGFLKDLEPVEELVEDNKSCCELANGSRIVSLPGDPDTVRGYSAPKLILLDEAAYIPDPMMAAIVPMLAVSRGRMIEMSSPNGRRGHFYEAWQHGIDVERIKITGRECPRISPQSLDEALRILGPTLFAQEYEGEFIDSDSSAFSSALIEMALVDQLSEWPAL